MKKHRFKIEGSDIGGKVASASLLREALGMLVDGARMAVRLRLDGKSTSRGTLPAWVEKGANFGVEVKPGSLVLVTHEKTFEEALPERFAQQDMFLEIDPKESALGCFFRGMEDALDGKKDSDYYDEGIISHVVGVKNLFSRGADKLTISNGRDRRVTFEDLKTVERLKVETPQARQVRLAGKLDAIRHHDRMFTLLVEGGHAVRGVAEQADENELANLWGKNVLVSGLAVFKPAGSLLRVEAATFQQVEGDIPELWAKLPTPLERGTDVRAVRKAQGSRSGVNAIIGRIPDELPDDEFIALLEAM